MPGFRLLAALGALVALSMALSSCIVVQREREPQTRRQLDGEDLTERPPPRTELGPQGPPGNYAPAYLQERGGRVAVEVLAQDGAEPARTTVDHVVQVLNDVSEREIALVERRRLPGGAQAWRLDDLAELAVEHSRAEDTDDQAVMRLVFVRGNLAQGQVAGASILGSVSVIFPDRLADMAHGRLAPADLERAIVTHEVGHLLGLVDLYLRTGREDPDHRGHSPNEDSVMHWAVEIGALEVFEGEPPADEFDAADLGDLREIRENG